MNDELPEMFERWQPPAAPAALRRRVLMAVDRELARPHKSRIERAFELAAAACLLVGIGLSAWQWNAETAWQRVAMPQKQADTAGEVWYADSRVLGDERLAAFVNRRVAQRAHSTSAADAGRELEKLLAEITKTPHG